jgi:hypothetical protein
MKHHPSETLKRNCGGSGQPRREHCSSCTKNALVFLQFLLNSGLDSGATAKGPRQHWWPRPQCRWPYWRLFCRGAGTSGPVLSAPENGEAGQSLLLRAHANSYQPILRYHWNLFPQKRSDAKQFHCISQISRRSWLNCRSLVLRRGMTR